MKSPLWQADQEAVPPNPRRRWLRPSALVILSVVAAAGSAIIILLITFRSDQAQVRLDIIKTGLAVGAGVGALITLMYGVRKQLLAEEIAQDSKADAVEKRVIELYTKGIDQFGSDKPQVRLGGLYALERLADSTTDLRDRVVDVICAYLRVEPDRRVGDRPDNLRLAAQTVLVDHLAYRSPFSYQRNFWVIKNLILSGAELDRFTFGAAKVDTVHFNSTIFRDEAFFAQAKFRGADFIGATFEGPAIFDETRIGKARFESAKFASKASFEQARFYIEANFTGAEFSAPPSFAGARALIHDEAHWVFPHMWEIRMPSTQDEARLPGEEGSWAYIVKTQRPNNSG